MSKSLVGIDFGGSSLKAVRVDHHGTILNCHTAVAGGQIPRETLVDVARQAIGIVSDGNAIAEIGLAFGGAIQPNGMMLSGSTNLPNIAGVALVPFFESQFNCKVRIENDARAAMRGEAWSGAAQNARNAMTLAFGTGIGSGLLVNDKIVEGAHGKAGEIGVWKLADTEFTFEDFCAPGRLVKANGQTFSQLFATRGSTPVIDMMGRAIANAHLLVDLEAVILLGGITELGEPLRHAVEEAFLAACPQDYQSSLAILIGKHGAFAGAVGAASLWREAEQ